jgi:uncharacterized YceG family protein
MSDRTEADREAARRERERRRADRAGRGAPALEADTSVEQPGDETAEERDFYRDDHEPALDDHEFLDDDHHHDEPAVGTRFVSRLHRHQAADRTPGQPRRAPRPVKRKRSWRGRILAVLAITLAGAVIWFLVALFQPFHGSGHGSVTVTIPTRASAGQIGDLLARDGVIPSSFFFQARAALGGDRGDLRSGTFHLKLDMSYGDVLKVLTTPPKPAKVSNLTVTEGRTRRQLDALLRAQHVKGSYFAETHHSKLLDPRAYGAPHNINSLEGFLFPSTYQLRDPITIPALVADQLKTFKQRWRSVNLSYARRHHLTPYGVLTIASMVEAEAQTKHDRPLVAAVIYNRLAKGMPLQIDATTRYLTGNYTQPLTVSELHSRSRYNTRIHTGLPPTPIGNPGMASIQAAAHPATKNYLYFVVKPCGNGEQVFTASYSQFLKLQAQYQSARSARGGRSPSHC